MNRSAAALSPELRGAALVISATLCFGLMDTLAKLLTERHDPLMVVWARYAGQMLLVLAIVAPRLGRVVRTRHPGLQALRSSLMFGATVLGFIAFSLLPLATAVAMFQVSPLVITAIAAVLLHEPVGPRRWTGVAVGFVGALIIVRPGTAVFEPAALLPLLGAVCYAGNTVMTRLLNGDGYLTTLFYSAAVGTLVSSLVVPFFWTTPDLTDAVMMAGMAVLGTGGHFVLIAAFATAQASALAPFTYASMIVSAALGYLVWHDLPDGPTLLGAALIIASGLYVWHRERLAAQRLAA